ncbi:MAG: hypothetical protein HY744_02220 [Deltaproteobacteria bacterium]|nr:hypothetical protein [Deltaproteobacteria bacterium]
MGVALLSGSLLAFQILVTRVCALRLHFHFGFLVISNCLLGIGASGTMLTLTEARWRRAPRIWIWALTGAYLASLGLVWLLLCRLPVPDSLRYASLADAARFLAFNSCAAVPFFFGGAAVGLVISVHAERVHAVYGSDLVGAGAGCALCPALLWHFGAGGCLLAVALLAAAAFAVLAPASRRRGSASIAIVVGLLCLGFMPSFDRLAPVPGKGHLDLTDRVRAVFARRAEYSRWSANSRIDVLPIDPARRLLLGRGAATLGLRLPAQKFILQDGSAGTIVSDFTAEPEGLEVLRRSLYALGPSLRRRPAVLVIGMGGGNDVWAAKELGARRIKAIELNQAVVEVHRTVARSYSRAMLADPRVQIAVDEARSALWRERGRFDVIQMSGADTWTALASGAYVLAENYLYTREALAEMYDRLEEGGVLAIIRMAAAMETLRLVATLDAALADRNSGGLAERVAILGASRLLAATLVKKGAFTAPEIEHLEARAVADGFERIYLPGRTLGGVVEQFVRTGDKRGFVAAFSRDISPVSDDRPYFFNFTRWRAPLASAKQLREVASVSQGNPLFLLGQLGLSAVLAAAFILAPLAASGRRRAERPADSRRLARFLAFFAAIGVGYIAVEVALLQKLTLVLGQPLYSLVVTLCSLLVCTGLGSMVSARWPGGARRAAWIAVGLLALLLVAFVLAEPVLLGPLAALGKPWRLLAAALLVAPLGLLLGVPFAYAVARLRRVEAACVPWAWAANGSASVVGSVATVVVSMNFGFDAVLLGAAAIYLLGFTVLGDAGGAAPASAGAPTRGNATNAAA